MNPEAKKLWTDALRSGEYAQGQGVLCEVDATGKKTYCCLGVLCEVAIKAGLQLDLTEEAKLPENKGGKIIRFDRNAGITPYAVKKWAGLQIQDPYIGDHCASTLNDTYNKTFSEIADLIDQHL